MHTLLKLKSTTLRQAHLSLLPMRRARASMEADSSRAEVIRSVHRAELASVSRMKYSISWKVNFRPSITMLWIRKPITHKTNSTYYANATYAERCDIVNLPAAG